MLFRKWIIEFPGKDVSVSDLRDKFRCSGEKTWNRVILHCGIANGVKFGPKNLVTFAGPNMVESGEFDYGYSKKCKKNWSRFSWRWSF